MIDIGRKKMLELLELLDLSRW